MEYSLSFYYFANVFNNKKHEHVFKKFINGVFIVKFNKKDGYRQRNVVSFCKKTAISLKHILASLGAPL